MTDFYGVFSFRRVRYCFIKLDICFLFLLDRYFILEKNMMKWNLILLSSLLLFSDMTRLMNMISQFRMQTMNELVSFCIFFESIAFVPVSKAMIGKIYANMKTIKCKWFRNNEIKCELLSIYMYRWMKEINQL